MTHPLDRVYLYDTPEQWGAGWSAGLRRGTGGGLQTPGALSVERLSGTTSEDGGALLARDPAGRLLWLRQDGTLLRLANGARVTVARLAADMAADAVRLLWGQRTGWIVAAGQLFRIDTGSGAATGTFSSPHWHVVDAVADECDGVVAVEIRRTTSQEADAPDEVRLRRIRADGPVHPGPVRHPIMRGHDLRAARRLDHGRALLVISAPDKGAWSVLALSLDGAATDLGRFPGDGEEVPGGPLALSGDGRLTLAGPDRRSVFAVDAGRIEPGEPLEPQDAFGPVRDLIDDGEALVVATAAGLFTLRRNPESAPARHASWVSPVMRSPIGDRRGWQRADLVATLPKGAEITIAARGFGAPSAAVAASEAFREGSQRILDDAYWAGAGLSLHRGTGRQERLRHYLGEIDEEYLLLRITVSVPACRGAARLDRLRVLYPNRSLIEMMPAIYRAGDQSERQVRRALAGLQAMIDEIDDTISDATRRLDPDRSDALWTGFLLHWLGHGALARLPLPDRRGVLKALPGIMARRGTEAGLARLLDVLAPGAYSIEDAAAGPADWLLSGACDPAAAQLGRTTRAGHTDPDPLRLGRCHGSAATALGSYRLGRGCGGETTQGCSSAVTVRFFGGADLETRLAPFLDPIRRLLAPAHTRLNFVFGDHRPEAGLATGPDAPRLGTMTLDTGGSRSLGDWALPGHDTGPDHPEDDAVLDRATLNGSLTLA